MNQKSQSETEKMLLSFGDWLPEKRLWSPVTGTSPPQGRSKYVAVCDGTDVACFTLDIPASIKTAARPAVARSLLMSRVAGPIESLHVHLLPPMAKQGPTQTVLVSETEKLFRTSALLDSRCIALVPDYALLPFAEQTWVLSTLDERVLFRNGADYGWSLEPDFARVALALMAREAAADTKVVLLTDARTLRDLLPNTLREHITEPQNAVLTLTDTNNLKRFDINKQPKLARATGQSPGRYAGLLVAGIASLIVLNVGIWGRTAMLETATQDTVAGTSALAREHYLGSAPLLSLRTQVERVIATRGGEPDTSPDEIRLYSDVFAAIATLLTTPDLEVQRIANFGTEGIAVALRAKTLSDVENLSSAIAALNMTVTRMQSQLTAEGDTLVELRVLIEEEG